MCKSSCDLRPAANAIPHVVGMLPELTLARDGALLQILQAGTPKCGGLSFPGQILDLEGLTKEEEEIEVTTPGRVRIMPWE